MPAITVLQQVLSISFCCHCQKNQLVVLENEKTAIDKKIAALKKEYSQVLEWMTGKVKRKKAPGKRAKRGQSINLIPTAQPR